MTIRTQVPTEQQVVDDFNASQTDIELVLEIVDYDSAFDAMSVEIAGGNAPDIVGPVGVSGAEAFHGQWLDLTDLIESTGYDMSPVRRGLGRLLQPGGDEGQIGLPFAIYPVDALLPPRHVRRGGPRIPAAARTATPYILDGEEVTGTSTRCVSSPCG